MKFMSVAITSENYKIQFSAKRKDKSWGLKDKKMFDGGSGKIPDVCECWRVKTNSN